MFTNRNDPIHKRFTFATMTKEDRKDFWELRCRDISQMVNILIVLVTLVVFWYIAQVIDDPEKLTFV